MEDKLVMSVMEGISKLTPKVRKRVLSAALMAMYELRSDNTEDLVIKYNLMDGDSWTITVNRGLPKD